MSVLTVTRLLQNPLGAPAPRGHRGDIVRVTDGVARIYLTPREFDRATEPELRRRLRQKAAGRAA